MVDTFYIRDCRCYKPSQCYGGCLPGIRCRQADFHQLNPSVNALQFWAQRTNWKRDTDDDE